MERALQIGIDFASDYVMASYYSFQTKETETISTITGSQKYKIPFSLAKKKGVGQWFYGEEAEEEVKNNRAIKVQNLLEEAVLGAVIEIETESFEAIDLLTLFFRKILMIVKKSSGCSRIESFTVCMEHVTKENITLMQKIADKLNIHKKKSFIIDRKESFCYYALSQQKEFWQKDCAIFYMQDLKMKLLVLNRNNRTNPQIINIEEQVFSFDLSKDKEELFCNIVQNMIAEYDVGTIYLVGDVFDDSWMKESKRLLCQNRRVFAGKNLFSKGACNCSVVKDHLFVWPFMYLGEHKMRFNLSFQYGQKQEELFYSLITAGENWYEAQNSCEVILKDEPKLIFFLQYPDKCKEILEEMILYELPNRPKKTTRLRICVIPKSAHEVCLTVKDLGFGEFFPASGKNWEKMIRF